MSVANLVIFAKMTRTLQWVTRGASTKRAKTSDLSNANRSWRLAQVARYLRIATLIPDFANDIDNGTISIRAAVELSWLQQAHQKIVAELAAAGCKVEYEQRKLQFALAQLLRQQADALTADQIKEVLQDSTAKSKQQQVSISPDLYARYFEHQKKKEVAAILEKALEMYFEAHN